MIRKNPTVEGLLQKIADMFEPVQRFSKYMSSHAQGLKHRYNEMLVNMNDVWTIVRERPEVQQLKQHAQKALEHVSIDSFLDLYILKSNHNVI